MTARQLRLLRVLGLEDIANAVEKLDVALLRVLLDSRDESPRHGSGGLSVNCCVGAWLLLVKLLQIALRYHELIRWLTYEVCESLLPDHIITSAGEVLVCFVFSYASSPLTADFAKPNTALARPAMSPRA